MKSAIRIALWTLLGFTSLTVFAQTTTTYAVQPTSCSTYSANYNCELSVATPSGPTNVFYGPEYNGRFNVVEFFSPLGDLGIAQVDSVTTSAPTLISVIGRNNTQGYMAVYQYSQQTTFHGESASYTGSSSIIYTTTTRCCSSGRGASQHTVWSVDSGSITVTE